MSTFRRLTAVALAALAFGSMAHAETARAGRIDTGVILFPGQFEGRHADEAFSRLRGSGANVVRLWLSWRGTGPGKPQRARDPRDPAYDWRRFDAKVKRAVRHGLQPLVFIVEAPNWASGSTGWDRPDPVALGRFAQAAATRYSGRFDPDPDDLDYGEALPRIRYWQVWNEPNLIYFLTPQYRRGRLFSADHYRSMVNRFSSGVKAVHATNLVLAGGTGPFRRNQNSSPLGFMRDFLCLRSDLRRQQRCGPVRFDIWGHHPYTAGGPTHMAARRDDVSLGDLPQMRRVLVAARRRGTIQTSGPVRFWIDEFSWDTNPPDPGAVPSSLHARWVAEGMYRMWRSGVSLVVWFQLMDNRWTGRCGNPFQSGLFHWSRSIVSARPKYSRAAFRFPFVAFREPGRVLVWGRTPRSQPGTVLVERRTGSRWMRVGSVRAGSSGVFSKRYAASWWWGSKLRARLPGKATSVPFSLTPVRDRVYQPFGARPAPWCN